MITLPFKVLVLVDLFVLRDSSDVFDNLWEEYFSLSYFIDVVSVFLIGTSLITSLFCESKFSFYD